MNACRAKALPSCAGLSVALLVQEASVYVTVGGSRLETEIPEVMHMGKVVVVALGARSVAWLLWW